MPRTARLLEATAVATPTLKAGDYVRWKASRGAGAGRVVSVHTSSHVPGVPVRVEGSLARPAVKVKVYARSAGAWAPTDVHVAMHVDRLEATDPLPEPSPVETKATEAFANGSFEAIRQAVREAVVSRIGELAGVCPYVWLCDIGTDWAVYETGGEESCMFLVNYTVDEAGAVELGEPTEVFELKSYVPVEEPAPLLPPPAPAPDATVPVADTGATMAQDGADGGAPATMTEGVVEGRETFAGRLLGARGVDSTGGRVFRVEIIRFGDSLNGRRYTEAVMTAGAARYEGARVYDHHRTDTEVATSTVAGLVGTIRNVAATSTGLEGDLVLFASASRIAEALEVSLENQAAGLPPLLGLSHDVAARYRYVDSGGRRLQEATEIVAVNSVDVVASPAAGGRVTRLVASTTDPTTPTPQAPNPTGGTPVLTIRQFLALLREADATRRGELCREHATLLESAGMSDDEAVRMAEALAAPVAPPAVVGATLARASSITRMVAADAVGKAGLPATLVDGILAELPDTFTEAELTTKVENYTRVLEGVERAGLTPRVGHVRVTSEDLDKKRKALDAMMAGNLREGYMSLKRAFIDWTGQHHFDAFAGDEMLHRSILRECAIAVSDHATMRFAESVDTSTFSYALGDSITRRLIAVYNSPDLQSWRPMVSSTIPVSDFRSQKIERVGGYGTLPAVAQAGPYQPLTTPSGEEITYSISKYGGTEDLTLEAIANDDVRVLQRIPQSLGFAAGQTLMRFVWNLILANPTMTYDSVALFHSSHSNTASNSLSASNVSTARKQMRKQAAYGDTSNVLGVKPRYLVTVPTLEELAFQICNSAFALPSGAPTGAATNTPNMHQGLEPILLDWYDGTSATFWMLVGDPSNVPTLELGFYNGRQDPELFVQSDPTVGSVFSADKITYKIRHIYGGTVLDHRGFQRGNS